MNGPQRTACLAKGYINSELARCVMTTDSGSHDKRRLSAASETDDALDLLAQQQKRDISFSSRNHHSKNAKFLVAPLNYRAATQTKNKYEKTQLDHISKLYTNGQLLTISTFSVSCRTEQARTH